MEPTINLWNFGLGYCAYSTKGEYRGVRDFPGGLVVETLFLMQRVLVPSLVGEVRFHMPGNVAGKEKKKKKEYRGGYVQYGESSVRGESLLQLSEGHCPS